MPARDVGKVDFAQSSVAAAPGQQPGVANAAPVAPASGATINTTDRSGDANMPAFDLSARSFGQPVTAPTAPQNDIKRTVGPDGTVSYSGQNIGPDATINGQTPGGGFVSVPAFRPAGFAPDQSQAGAVQAPTVSHSGNSWAARNELRNREVSASSIMNNGGRWDQHGRGVVSPERMAYLAALKNDMDLRGAQPGMDKAAMEQTGANQRTAMAQSGEDRRAEARNALDADRLDIDRQVKGFDIRQAQRKESILQRYDAAKTDEERAALIKQHPEVFGLDKESAPRMEVVRGSVDPMTGKRDGDYALIFNPKNNSVQRVGVDGQAAPQQKFEDGKVYTDANGNRRKWDEKNKQWQPV